MWLQKKIKKNKIVCFEFLCSNRNVEVIIHRNNNYIQFSGMLVQFLIDQTKIEYNPTLFN